ncbi:MAG: UDP-N-acetylenolpyruvoylglucosamine reductase [Chloroflexi bacterium B3_Chlor]|nr:MAG: UDP-N-acetylenolpyruvoylglucosamine reductase [Chloroflexi bacterium B3_Chlor]
MSGHDLQSLAHERGLSAELVRDEPLSRHTSYRIGGPADFFSVAKNEQQLCGWTKVARELKQPYLIIGRGTNLLVADKGFRGLVIENRCLDFTLDGTSQTVHAQTGVPLALLARKTAERGSAGLEWAIGIPGTVGGAIVNNAGAYNGTMEDVVRRVAVLDLHGEVREILPEQLKLGYRTSRFREQEHHREVILSVDLRLTPQSPKVLADRMTRYSALRRAAQPSQPSAGSVFKNPVGLSAAQLIEQAGLKGKRIGDAQISHKHANYIVNLGSAKANDVLQLTKLVRNEICELFGAELELEIELVGEWGNA